MNVEHEPKIRQVELGEGPITQDSRVIDQYVDATPAAQRKRHHALDGTDVLHIRSTGERLTS